MRVTLNESEIKDALIQYVAGHGVAVAGRDVSVSLVAGRGPNGHSATIDISNAGTTTASYLSDTVDVVDVTATVGETQQAFPDTSAETTSMADANENQAASADKSLFGPG